MVLDPSQNARLGGPTPPLTMSTSWSDSPLALLGVLFQGDQLPFISWAKRMWTVSERLPHLFFGVTCSHSTGQLPSPTRAVSPHPGCNGLTSTFFRVGAW